MLSDRFRAAVEQGDVRAARELFHEDATFRSPVVFKPYEGRERVMAVLQAAKRVLGDSGTFRYLHQLENPNDRVAILSSPPTWTESGSRASTSSPSTRRASSPS
jgi:ketosteroid isomerase-like protein